MDEEKKYCVYKHTSPSGKVYIGMTGQKPEKRWRNGKGYRYNPHFWRAIQKYGWDKFEHEIVFNNLTKKDAENKERELITFYKSNEDEYGYNLDLGGNCPGKMSEGTKNKIRESNIGKHSIPRTEEYKMRVKLDGTFAGKKNGFYGKKHSSESRAKMSGPRSNIIGENNPFYGKVHSRDIIEKIRSASIKAPVFCIELNKYFDCAETVIKDKSLHASGVRKALNGEIPFAGKHPETKEKLHWRYATEEEVKNVQNSSI